MATTLIECTSFKPCSIYINTLSQLPLIVPESMRREKRWRVRRANRIRTLCILTYTYTYMYIYLYMYKYVCVRVYVCI